ncbi:uncharacterized protein N0V89_012472 [Didymosphaeria variabile]|uniref:Uncharacterized protein n=1 Tax=Didymosphaeria variabile TaxID=1932322 RepID=A0A9W9C4H4_9PLEO|nr:uncharacterized protein N0V89_012472 [Didymosphaeria variabile]KAJ4344728.1 hypothetical protein N0V89_012472 [Didymosphaeria variabile]
MQFSIIIAAFAAAASAQYTYSNGTSATGTAAPSGTASASGSAAPSSTAPFEGAGIANGPAMAVLLGAGAAALMI